MPYTKLGVWRHFSVPEMIKKGMVKRNANQSCHGKA